MRYALIHNGTVTNIILWDGVSPYAPPQGCEMVEVSEPIGIGWTVDGSVFSPPQDEPVSEFSEAIDV